MHCSDHAWAQLCLDGRHVMFPPPWAISIKWVGVLQAFPEAKHAGPGAAAAVHFLCMYCLQAMTWLRRQAPEASPCAYSKCSICAAGANLGPFFKWAGALRQTFAEAEHTNEGEQRKSTLTRKAAIAYLRNKNTMLLKVRFLAVPI